MAWKVEKFDLSLGGQGIQVVDESGAVICDNEPYYPAKLKPEYAHLIAAAPAMLEALQLMDAYLFATAPESNERQIVQLAIAAAEAQP